MERSRADRFGGAELRERQTAVRLGADAIAAERVTSIEPMASHREH